jgi:hypothetical protein
MFRIRKQSLLSELTAASPTRQSRIGYATEGAI